MRIFQQNSGEKIGINCILASIYFIALPLTITINSSGDSFLKLLTLPIAVFMLLSLFFYKDKLELNFVHGMFAGYILSVIITLFADRTAEAQDYVIGYVQNAALMFCISVRRYNSKEIELFENAQIVLLAILIFMGLFGGASYADRTTIQIFGGVSDPNYFSGFFIFPIAVCLDKIRKNKQRILCVVLMILGIYVVLLSGSRGGLLAVIVTLIAHVILSSKDFKNFIITTCIFIIFAVLFWIIVLPILPENIVERLSIEAVIESRGTYRGDIWISMLNEIGNSTWELFVGRGINAKHMMIVAGKMQEVVAHNNFIQVLYNQGFIGLVSFIGICVASFARNLRKRTYISVGVIGMLVLTLTLTINPSIKSFWNLIIYSSFSFAVYGQNIIRQRRETSEIRTAGCSEHTNA